MDAPPTDAPVTAAEMAVALSRVVELLALITDALARIERQQEPTNELLGDVNRSQWA